jgi:hypothetical protein
MTASEERRGAPRFPVSARARFLLNGEHEGEGSILDISETGVALCLETPAKAGDRIIIYAEGLGRLCGRVVRKFSSGVGVALSLTPSQRATTGKKIAAALNGAQYLRLVEERSGLRRRYNIETSARWGDKSAPVACTIVDMSSSGCRLKCGARPAVGEKVVIGVLKGFAVRHTEDGFAVEFAANCGTKDETRAEDQAPKVVNFNHATPPEGPKCCSIGRA